MKPTRRVMVLGTDAKLLENDFPAFDCGLSALGVTHILTRYIATDAEEDAAAVIDAKEAKGISAMILMLTPDLLGLGVEATVERASKSLARWAALKIPMYRLTIEDGLYELIPGLLTVPEIVVAPEMSLAERGAVAALIAHENYSHYEDALRAMWDLTTEELFYVANKAFLIPEFNSRSSNTGRMVAMARKTLYLKAPLVLATHCDRVRQFRRQAIGYPYPA